MSAMIMLPLAPAEMGRALAARLRSLRLAKGWTRHTLAMRAGITAASLKRFENFGKASLELVLKTAHALARLEDFNKLLEPPAAQSLAELEKREALPARKRGSI